MSMTSYNLPQYVLQGVSQQKFTFIQFALADKSMQVKFVLKVILES